MSEGWDCGSLSSRGTFLGGEAWRHVPYLVSWLHLYSTNDPIHIICIFAFGAIVILFPERCCGSGSRPSGLFFSRPPLPRPSSTSSSTCLEAAGNQCATKALIMSPVTAAATRTCGLNVSLVCFEPRGFHTTGHHVAITNSCRLVPAHCTNYLCPGTLACVSVPHHCPCAHPDTEEKVELGEGSAICVSKGGYKAGEAARKIELARKGLL